LPHFGQVHKHHVAQRVLRVHGDADGGDVAVDVDPFVVFGVLDAHGVLLKLRWGANKREALQGTRPSRRSAAVVAVGTKGMAHDHGHRLAAHHGVEQRVPTAA
jgi:hypothetical protein